MLVRAYILNQSESSVFLDTRVYKEGEKGIEEYFLMFSLWISIRLG